MEEINSLLKKYDNFRAAQLRTIQQLPDSSKIITIVVQDDDGEDINTVKLTFNNINNSHILVDSVLPYLDMMSGISIIKEHDLYGFAVGRGDTMFYVHSAPLFIVASDITIEEE